ncbi:hypothetical protein CI109_102814 [Kwoniella shandongensis]|uniref:Uncharacterized protein n=1 Tax=Kwoniella shandongensis TaxID=1734106 RepID=A0A5M6C7Q4_9TREE|nr:uncharacterized protein CI109_000005 [Kwoniella shandongensis]KAA5531167.1 hypothetical protein CI109_000005 [Kwoniella shandongensis]
MLPSARQACTRRLASAVVAPSSFSQALPAESSRQALLRAITSTTNVAPAAARKIHSESSTRRESIKGKKGRGISSSSGVTYSAAVALAEDDRHQHCPSSSHTSSSRELFRYPDSAKIRTKELSTRHEPPYGVGPDSDTTELSDIQQKRTNEWLDSWLHTYDLSSLPPSPLPPLETFRGLIPSQPLLALLTLTTLSQNDLASIRHHELRSVVCRAAEVLRESPAIALRLKSEESAKALRIVRAIAYALPSEKFAKDAFTGRYLNGKLLRHLLYLCDRLGVPRLAKSIWQERLQAQVARDAQPPILQFDNIARDLSSIKSWKTIVEFFSLETFPHRYYSSHVIDIYMQAHFGIHKGSKVPRLFQLFDMLNLKPTTASFNHLLQAFLENGDLPTARAIVREANVTGVSDYASQQLAILRGYRALGFDQDLEKRVLHDIERLGLPLQARLLNALVRLRVDAGDISGAEELMGKFDLDHWSTSDQQGEADGARGVRPTAKTAKLMFTVSAKSGNLDRIKLVWGNLCENVELIDDGVVTTLLEAMTSVGLLKEAGDLLLSTAITEDAKRHSSDWTLPPGVKPGVRSFNHVLGAMARQDGLAGVEKAMEIMAVCGVKPNDLTLKFIVDFARTDLRHSPHDLATLVAQLMEASPDRTPTQSLLDSVLADAVASGAKASTAKTSLRELTPSASEDTFQPTAGLEMSAAFHSAVSRIIQALEAIDSRSTSRSLANRLRFDAMTSTEINSQPSARIVWNALIARGFKPDQRHVTALMQGYADAGHMYEARNLLSLASQIGVPITRSMLLVLLVGWGKKERGDVRRGRLPYARNMYEQIRRSEEGLDLRTVTAMIQALTYARKYKEAKRLCYTDLADLDVGLDKKALTVATQALRFSGDLKGALELMKRHDQDGLGTVGRKVVRGIKGYARKVNPDSQTEEYVDVKEKEEGEESSLVEIAEELMKKDKTMRSEDKKRWSYLGRGTRRRLVRAWKVGNGSTSRPSIGSGPGVRNEGRGRTSIRASSSRKGKAVGVSRPNAAGQKVGSDAIEARRVRRREEIARRRRSAVES